jgi:hypothetical protein
LQPKLLAPVRLLAPDEIANAAAFVPQRKELILLLAPLVSIVYRVWQRSYQNFDKILHNGFSLAEIVNILAATRYKKDKVHLSK